MKNTKDYDKLLTRISLLEEALRFYAEEYYIERVTKGSPDEDCYEDVDHGKVARCALGLKEDESGDPRSISKEEHEANARLISAAPEMLEVLRWLDAEMDSRDDDYEGVLFSRADFEKVRRAIKRAMGD